MSNHEIACDICDRHGPDNRLEFLIMKALDEAERRGAEQVLSLVNERIRRLSRTVGAALNEMSETFYLSVGEVLSTVPLPGDGAGGVVKDET